MRSSVRLSLSLSRSPSLSLPLSPLQLEHEEEDDDQKTERHSQLYDFFQAVAGENFEIDAFELKGVLTEVFKNGESQKASLIYIQ